MGGQMVGERLASRPRRRCYGGKKGPGDDRDGFGFESMGWGLVRGAPGHGAVGVAEDVLGDIFEAECELDSRRGRCHGRRGRAQRVRHRARLINPLPGLFLAAESDHF